MEAIKETVRMICLTGIGIALIKILLPEKCMQKQIKLVFSLVFLFAIIMPFTNGKISFDIQEFEAKNEVNYSEFENQVKENLNEQTANIISSKLATKLNENQIPTEKITVLTNISDNNCIIISKVICVLFNENQATDAERIIKGEADKNTEIIIQKSEW